MTNTKCDQILEPIPNHTFIIARMKNSLNPSSTYVEFIAENIRN